MFLGTEFGVYFTNNAAKNWTKLKGGMPNISVRDLAIQKSENDLVLGTFGRGIYILDDYSSLRDFAKTIMKLSYLIQEKDIGIFRKEYLEVVRKPLKEIIFMLQKTLHME